MSLSIIKLLIDVKAVKTQCGTVVEENGDTREVPTHLVCGYCTIGKWAYMKNGNKPTKCLIERHLSTYHASDWRISALCIQL